MSSKSDIKKSIKSNTKKFCKKELITIKEEKIGIKIKKIPPYLGTLLACIDLLLGVSKIFSNLNLIKIYIKKIDAIKIEIKFKYSKLYIDIIKIF